MIARYGDTDYGYSEAGYGYGVSAFTGFDGLSIIPDTLGWWSVARRVLSRYTGPIIRLRRSSDSTERDFYGIGPQGEVSTAAVRAWNGWNLLAYTDDFGNAYWIKSDTSISPDATTSPFGLADAILETATTASHSVTRVVQSGSRTYPVGTRYAATIIVKANGRSRFDIRESANAVYTATFNLTNVTTSASGATGVSPTSEIVSLGDGWFRCTAYYTEVSEPPASTIPRTFQIRILNDAGSTSYLGETDKGLFVAGVQLERASSFSTYEPRTTTGAGDSFLVTLYDQSGLARHFTQSTTTLQPIICEQGVPVTENGRLAAKFVAADARRMSIASSTAMFNALHTTGGTVLCVSRANDTAATKSIVRNNAASTLAGFAFGRSGGENVFTSSARLDVAGVATNGNSMTLSHGSIASTAQSIVAALYDPDNATAASRVFAWQNGTASTDANASTGTPFVENASGNLTLGAASDGSLPHDGPISEVALFSALISTADRTAWQSRSGVFYTVAIS